MPSIFDCRKLSRGNEGGGGSHIKDESKNIVAKELLMSLFVYAQLTCGFPWLMGEKF